ncbi:hypothetical protein AT302_14170 [Pandoraea norimbergensis]|uniref:PilX/PilW C-terminal domain-containing protein n=2 Tax=Pandoraea norimbergensis TaxID=93219 RepID=A0ABM5WJZ1_9BURK|nr:hypothetical protein AT302_14170 [Pandoraea norimbergensis]
MMWLAALMTLAASGSHHRQLSGRFAAYTNDRARAFAAAEGALSEARHWLTHDANAVDIASARDDTAGPYGILAPENRIDWPLDRTRRWQTMRWDSREATNESTRGRYFVERIAYAPEALAVAIGVGARAAGSIVPSESEKRDALPRRYRVSAVGYADLPGTNVYLQAIYEVRRVVVPEGVSGGAAPVFTSRRLNWREVTVWQRSSPEGRNDRIDRGGRGGRGGRGEWGRWGGWGRGR